MGDDGLLEIKTAKAAILVALLLKGDFPPEHRAQVQGQLWVSERKWCDLVVYWPGLPLFVHRVERDNDYIRGLAEEVALFNDQLADVVAQVEQYGEHEGTTAEPVAPPPDTVDMNEQPPVF